MITTPDVHITSLRLEHHLLDGLRRVKDRDGIPISEQLRRAILLWLDARDITVAAPPARPTPERALMGMLYRQPGRTIWMMKIYRPGHRRPIVESTGTNDKREAKKVLRKRETDVDTCLPLAEDVGRVRFEAAAADVIADYKTTGKSSLKDVRRRIDKHLTPFFGGRRLVAITTSDVRAYTVQRQAAEETVSAAYTVTRTDGTQYTVPERRRAMAGAAAGTINRELTTLKRIFSLALKAGRIVHKPFIPLLVERNVRSGFLEAADFEALRRHLPAPIQAVATFAFLTGWRIPSEVLTLEWRRVDFASGEVRLDGAHTKNREPRVFIMTDDLRALLKAQAAQRQRLEKAGFVVPWVFVRLVAKGRGGPTEPRRISSITKAWRAACVAAGLPNLIPHDLRRSAIRTMVRRGVPERVAMRLSGHKTRSVFERYNVISDSDIASAATLLSGQLGRRKRSTTTAAQPRVIVAAFGRRK